MLFNILTVKMLWNSILPALYSITCNSDTVFKPDLEESEPKCQSLVHQVQFIISTSSLYQFLDNCNK